MNQRTDDRPRGRQKSRARVRQAPGRRAILRCEGLEGRALMTAGIKWAQGIGGGDLLAQATAADAAGDVFVAGTFSGSVNFDPAGNTTLSSRGGRDAFLAKYTPAGALAWAKDLGGSGDDLASALVVDSRGNVAVAGQFQGAATFGATTLAAQGGVAAFVAEFANDGTPLWAAAGTGAGSAQANALAVGPQGDIVVAGQFSGAANFSGATVAAPGSYYNGFLADYSAAGALRYAAGFGGNSYLQATAVAVDAQGNAYVGGSVYGNGSIGGATLASRGGYDGFLAGFNAAGAPLWADDLGGSGNDQVNGVAVDAQGGVYATGSFANAAALGGVTLGGGASNAFVAKAAAASGNVLWAKGYGGTTGINAGAAVVADAAGNLTVGGQFSNAVNFNPGGGGGALTSTGGTDGFVLQLDAAGTFQSAKGYGGGGNDAISALALGSGMITTVGTYVGPAIFGSSVLPNLGSADFFVVQIPR